MRKIYLLLTLFVLSLTNMWADTVTDDCNLLRKEAMSNLKSYLNASPFGHRALNEGLNRLAALGENSSTADVRTAYTQAILEAAVELDENLYRVRVTIANVGVNKDNADKPLLLGVANSENSNCDFKLTDTQANVSIWRFNIASEGKYTIACNVGQYIGYKENEYSPDNEKEIDLCPTTDMDQMYEFNVAYAENGEGVTFSIGGKYLSMDADGKFSFVNEVTDNAVWKLSRAYDEKLDLPVLSTDANPVYYTLENESKGLMTVEGSYINCKPLDEHSYWYFVDAGEKIGSFRLKNKKDNYGITYTTANGRIRAKQNVESNSMLFIMLEGNEAHGWSVSCHPTDHLTTYGYQTNHALMYDPGYDWVCGGAPRFNMNNIPLFTWNVAAANNESGSEEDFINLKAALIQLYTYYKLQSPWCESFLKNTITELNAFDIKKYTSTDKALEALETYGKNAADKFFTQINKEALGYNVKISNVRRFQHANVSTLGHYLTAVGEGDKLTLNTVNSLERGPGFWNIEAVEGKKNAFRLRNQNGIYLCNVTNNVPVATTTNAEEAGLYCLLPYDSFIRIANADLKGSGLNFDTNGNTLVGYDYKDDGSTWSFESVAIIPHTEGMPKISDNTNKYLYLVRSATDEKDYLEFDADGIGLSHRPLSSASYCYFVPASDGSDGVQIVCEEYGTRLCYSPVSNYFYSRISGWDTNPNFNLYIVPNGTVPEGTTGAGQTCFSISHKYPSDGPTCISNLSKDNKHDYYISCGLATDWQHTGWIFEETETINHEEIFKQNVRNLLAEIESYSKAIPWAHDMIEALREKVENAKMTDYAEQTPAAVNGLLNDYNQSIMQIEEQLELEPENAWVSISNVRRLGNKEAGAYLTAKNGYLNTSDALTDAGKWQMKYHSNGRYNLINANGQYMGELSDRVKATKDEADAGKYALKLLNGYVCLVDRADENNRSLNVNPGQDDACVYSPADAGSRWIIALTTVTGIEESLHNAALSGCEYFTPAGIKVAPERLTPGVYLRVQGNKTTKVLVK